MNSPHSILVLRGAAVTPYLDDVAGLRIAVFADWPYLYRGDPGYERDYQAAYAVSPDSVFVLALEGSRVVGASTGLPLADDAPAFSEPFRAAGIAPQQVFFFGESVLLPAWISLPSPLAQRLPFAAMASRKNGRGGRFMAGSPNSFAAATRGTGVPSG